MTNGTGPAADGDRIDPRSGNSGQASGPNDCQEQSAKPSPEELQRLVSLHLGSGSRQRSHPPWVVRLLSAVLALLALVLLFTVLPAHCYGGWLP
ncbi:MAG: hypothetical protein IH612_00545 [Desulfofustis sp.]|nr:hypothetical protein [Desulfofustis sp.]